MTNARIFVAFRLPEATSARSVASARSRRFFEFEGRSTSEPYSAAGTIGSRKDRTSGTHDGTQGLSLVHESLTDSVIRNVEARLTQLTGYPATYGDAFEVRRCRPGDTLQCLASRMPSASNYTERTTRAPLRNDSRQHFSGGPSFTPTRGLIGYSPAYMQIPPRRSLRLSSRHA